MALPVNAIDGMTVRWSVRRFIGSVEHRMTAGALPNGAAHLTFESKRLSPFHMPRMTKHVFDLNDPAARPSVQAFVDAVAGSGLASATRGFGTVETGTAQIMQSGGHMVHGKLDGPNGAVLRRITEGVTTLRRELAVARVPEPMTLFG